MSGAPEPSPAPAETAAAPGPLPAAPPRPLRRLLAEILLVAILLADLFRLSGGRVSAALALALAAPLLPAGAVAALRGRGTRLLAAGLLALAWTGLVHGAHLAAESGNFERAEAAAEAAERFLFAHGRAPETLAEAAPGPEGRPHVYYDGMTPVPFSYLPLAGGFTLRFPLRGGKILCYDSRSRGWTEAEPSREAGR